MLPEVHQIDLAVLRSMLEYVNAHPWLGLVVYLVAEVLVYILAVILYLLWRHPEPASKHHGNKKAVLLALMSVIVALAVKSLIAFLVLRERPVVSHPELMVMQFRVDPSSFPSGHTLVAFAGAFSLLFSKARPWGTVFLISAAAIGVSRVAAGVHYPTDIIAGALLGYLAAGYIHREASGLKRYLPNHEPTNE